MIIIPDFDMPRRCYECPCFNDTAVYCDAKLTARMMGTPIQWDKAQGGRPEWCPLIEKKPGIRILRRHKHEQ